MNKELIIYGLSLVRGQLMGMKFAGENDSVVIDGKEMVMIDLSDWKDILNAWGDVLDVSLNELVQNVE